jgi:hypothetical protein
MLTIKNVGVACSVLGLCIAALGALITARAVVISEERAQSLSETRWNGNSDLKASILSQSQSARRGLLLILTGTMFQIAGTLAGALQ